VTVLSDVTRGGTRELALRLSSGRDASTLGMWVDAGSATVRGATVAGRDVPTDRAQGKWAFGFRFHGAPAAGVEVRLQLDQHADGVAVRVADSTHDLGVVPGFTPPPGRVLVTPEVVVTRTLTLLSCGALTPRPAAKPNPVTARRKRPTVMRRARRPDYGIYLRS
jgi:hypothetical protein